MRTLAILSTIALCGTCFGATLTVTSPARGTVESPTLVGESTALQLRLTGMVNSARVVATVRRQADDSVVFNLDTDIQPDNDLIGSGSLQLSFAAGSSEETYRVEVRATDLNGETTYNTDQDLFVRPDLTKPKFLWYSPLTGSFVKGTVQIRARIDESNLRDWRVQVDGVDIPGNTGTTLDANGELSVAWNAGAIKEDGVHMINIRVRDQADNTSGRTMAVTLDRAAPKVTIQSPRAGTEFAPGTTITVVVDINDGNISSVNTSGVDVIVRNAAGTFVTRVSRISFRIGTDGTIRWTGRIAWRPGVVPSPFTVFASVIDKAGNKSTTQSVTCTFGG